MVQALCVKISLDLIDKDIDLSGVSYIGLIENQQIVIVHKYHEQQRVSVVDLKTSKTVQGYPFESRFYLLNGSKAYCISNSRPSIIDFSSKRLHQFHRFQKDNSNTVHGFYYQFGHYFMLRFDKDQFWFTIYDAKFKQIYRWKERRRLYTKYLVSSETKNIVVLHSGGNGLLQFTFYNYQKHEKNCYFVIKPEDFPKQIKYFIQLKNERFFICAREKVYFNILFDRKKCLLKNQKQAIVKSNFIIKHEIQQWHSSEQYLYFISQNQNKQSKQTLLTVVDKQEECVVFTENISHINSLKLNKSIPHKHSLFGYNIYKSRVQVFLYQFKYMYKTYYLQILKRLGIISINQIEALMEIIDFSD